MTAPPQCCPGPELCTPEVWTACPTPSGRRSSELPALHPARGGKQAPGSPPGRPPVRKMGTLPAGHRSQSCTRPTRGHRHSPLHVPHPAQQTHSSAQSRLWALAGARSPPSRGRPAPPTCPKFTCSHPHSSRAWRTLGGPLSIRAGQKNQPGSQDC